MEQLLTTHPIYSYVYAGRQNELRQKYGIDLQPEQFRRVADQISNNPTMLRKDEHALYARYERGDLCALVARRKNDGHLEEQVLGTVTMDLLVDFDRIINFFPDEISLLRNKYPTYASTFPALYELGAVDLDPEVRGHKLAHLIHDAALEQHAENIRRRRTLVVLTTQRPEEILTIDSSEHIPTTRDPLVKQLEFRVYARGQVPGVDVFTCTCTSAKKRGYGIGMECQSAVRVVPTPLRGEMIRLIESGTTQIDCHIGISSGDYAQNYSAQVLALGKILGSNVSVNDSLVHVVQRLRDRGYYD